MYSKSSKWYVKRPNELNQLKKDLKKSFPTLRILERMEHIIVTGAFPVKSAGGKILNEYVLEIILPDNYPNDLPKIIEIQGRIPLSVDWHANPADKTLCIVLPSDYWATKEECALIDYLQGDVNSFFIATDYYRLKKEWPFGEHRHGYDGCRDYYAERLSIEDRNIVQLFIFDLYSNRLKGHDMCPCGSAKKLRHCHAEILWRLRREMPEDRMRKYYPLPRGN